MLFATTLKDLATTGAKDIEALETKAAKLLAGVADASVKGPDGDHSNFCAFWRRAERVRDAEWLLHEADTLRRYCNPEVLFAENQSVAHLVDAVNDDIVRVADALSRHPLYGTENSAKLATLKELQRTFLFIRDYKPQEPK